MQAAIFLLSIAIAAKTMCPSPQMQALAFVQDQMCIEILSAKQPSLLQRRLFCTLYFFNPLTTDVTVANCSSFKVFKSAIKLFSFSGFATPSSKNSFGDILRNSQI